MQRREDQLEMALDLFKAGVDQDTHLLLATANNMLSLGYMKMVDITIPLSELNSEREEELRDSGVTAWPEAPPDPNLARTPSAMSRMRPHNSTRTPTTAGIQWGSKWVDPNNTEPAKPGAERAWSGWAGMVPNQKAIMQMFAGEKGRYTLGVQSVINFIKKNPAKNKGKERKHLKPHYLMNSLSRRGLVHELDTDVWILTPRGEVFVREFLGMEPTPKHDSVSSVA